MKNVLVVDDENSFLRSLSDGLNTYSGDFSVLTAENGNQAVEVLKSTKIELVVTDLKMPEMDGLKLLAHMSKNYPDTPAIVMTAYGNPKLEHHIKKLGISQYIEKPLDFDALVDKIFEILAPSSKKYIHGVTLSSFLQLVEIEKKTCTLKINSNGKLGYLYFLKGELFDAETGSARGEEAALTIVSWEDTEIEIDYGCKKKEKNIGSPLFQVIMEGLRMKNERSDKSNERLDDSNTLEKLEETFISIDDSHSEKEFPLKTQKESIEKDQPGPHLEKAGKEDEMVSFKEALKEFTELQGVNAVCLASRDGFVLDSISKSGIDTEMVGAIASSSFGASESMGRQLEKGTMAMSMLEFEGGLVMISPVGTETFLVIDASQDANLGMVRFMIKKHKDKIEASVTAATF